MQIVKTLVQSVGIFLLIQFATKQFFGQTPATGDPATGGAVVPNTKVSIPAFADRPTHFNDGAVRSVIPQNVAPMWPVGTEVDITLYISPSIAMPPFKQLPADSLLIDEKGFKFGDYAENRVIETEFKVPAAVQRNATLFAHFYVAHTGSPLDPTQSGYDKTKAYHIVRALTQFHPKKQVKKTRNLLSDMPDSGETEEEKKTPKVMGSFYHSNFTISMIPDSGVLNYPTMHAGVREFIQLDQTGSRDATGQHGWYYPVLFTNTFWQLKKDMIELNETVSLILYAYGYHGTCTDSTSRSRLFRSTSSSTTSPTGSSTSTPPWKPTSAPTKQLPRVASPLPVEATDRRWRCSRRSSSTATRTSSP